jgi:hypothetical protein
MTYRRGVLAGTCSQIINPGQDFLQNEYPNGSTQRSDTVTAGTLRGEETANAVNFRDQLSHGSLALERD